MKEEKKIKKNKSKIIDINKVGKNGRFGMKKRR